MKQEKIKLTLKLRAIAETINNDKEKINQVIELLKEHNIQAGEVSRLIQGNLLLETLDIEYLYLYTKALYEVTRNSDIKVEDWFTNLEIASGDSYYFSEEEKIDELVFHNVTQNKQRHFVCPKISDVELAKIMRNRVLTYNIQTQRPTIKTVVYDTLTDIPDVRPHKVDQIKNEILKGTFTGNILSVNIRKTGKEYYEYDPETMTLRIPVKDDTFIDIVDGAHRLSGIAKAVREKPDLDDCMSLNILNYDIKEARNFIKQESKASPIRKSDLKAYGYDDTDMMIAQDLNTFENEKTNVLFNKLTDNILEVEYRDKYTTFDVISKTLKHVFEYDEDESYDIQKVKENLVRGFNEILGYLKHKNGDLEKKKKDFVFLESNMFIGYTTLLSKLWNSENKTFDRNWDIDLHDMLDGIDFSRQNLDWENISLFNNKVNKTTITKVVEYFNKKGDDVIGKEDKRERIS